MNQSEDAPEGEGNLANAMEYELCGMDCDLDAKEHRFEEMRREELRERAIAWLREQRAVYIDTRHHPNLIQGFHTYKRTRARRRVR